MTRACTQNAKWRSEKNWLRIQSYQLKSKEIEAHRRDLPGNEGWWSKWGLRWVWGCRLRCLRSGCWRVWSSCNVGSARPYRCCAACGNASFLSLLAVKKKHSLQNYHIVQTPLLIFVTGWTKLRHDPDLHNHNYKKRFWRCTTAFEVRSVPFDQKNWVVQRTLHS